MNVLRRTPIERDRVRLMSNDDIARLVINRNPCARCGTRMDYHDTLGCKRFVAEVVA
ncbi:hypothetical protein [Croceicoccus sp. Ery15]|uniref:hypothetical protein n=1 Tax=Croceicoccus sp. Ery15 TaxID=1703338 RepID=UPI001E438AEC|nr:hypothetical protein [Croceicoccus sp. Ery15]